MMLKCIPFIKIVHLSLSCSYITPTKNISLKLQQICSAPHEKHTLLVKFYLFFHVQAKNNQTKPPKREFCSPSETLEHPIFSSPYIY